MCTLRSKHLAGPSTFSIAIREGKSAICTQFRTTRVVWRGAIAAMCVAGDYEIQEIVVVAGGDEPSSPCGGCRQKISEFSEGNVVVTMVATGGST